MFFDPKPRMTKQRLFNFFVGSRGDGKTTGSRNYGIDEYIKAKDRGERYEIAYVRRYKEERKISASKLFADIGKFNYGMTFKTKGLDTFIDDDHFCHCYALSVDSRIKGAASPDLRLIIFDEFLVDPKKSRYLPDEVNTFLGLYDTLARPTDPTRKPVTVLFLANSFSVNNPYFNFFHINFPKGKNTFMTKEIYAEIIQNHEFEDHARNTRFGQLIAGTDYARHSIGNEFVLDDNSFIYPHFDKGQFLFTVKLKGIVYGCWVNWRNGTLYISTKYDPSCQCNYVFTRDDYSPNLLTAKRFKETFHGKLTRDCYNAGAVYYESLKVKSAFMEIARLANL